MRPGKSLAERAQEAEERMGKVGQELPRYQSHKKVWALKIARIEILNAERSDPRLPGALITPADAGYSPLIVLKEYVQKHDPREGGYFVLYDDNYTSWSPTQAFESGYTKLR